MPEQTNPTVKAKLLDISPLAPLRIVMEVEHENGEKELAHTIVFIDQSEGKIYDQDGPVEESMENAVLQWIQKKQEDLKKEAMKTMIKATPEQLAAMGIDLNEAPPRNSGKIILTR